MVGFGLGPILGAGLGGFVYETSGAMTLYAGASVLALAGGVVAWFALRGPELDRPLNEADDVPADPSIAPPEPLGEAVSGSQARTVAAHRDLVAGLFPELALDAFEAIVGGWTCDTYRVDGEWIVQPLARRMSRSDSSARSRCCPSSPARSRRRCRCPSSSHGNRCMGYRALPGDPCDQAGDGGVWPERLGRFLYDLHLVPPSSSACEPFPRSRSAGATGRVERLAISPPPTCRRTSSMPRRRRSTDSWTTTPHGASLRA